MVTWRGVVKKVTENLGLGTVVAEAGDAGCGGRAGVCAVNRVWVGMAR